MGPAGDLPSGVDQDAVADYAAIAQALCGAWQVVLLLLPSSSEPRVAFSQIFNARNFHAGGFDAGPPPDVQALLGALLGLHPGDRDEPVFCGVAGGEGCGVALRDASGEVAGLLCLLRHGAFPPGLPAAITAALRGLGRRLAAHLFPPRQEQPLADAMTELAWSCDARGAVTWCNRAFAEHFPIGPERDAFLERWAAASHGARHEGTRREGLVPARIEGGGRAWFATRREGGSKRGAGYAVDVTARLDAEIALARLGPLGETRGSSLLALDRVVVAMAERISGMLPPGLPSGLAPLVRNPSDASVTVRCEPHLLENALLDAALACAASTDPGALTITLGTQGSQAVLGLESGGGIMPDPSTLPMLQPLLDACGGSLRPGVGAAGGALSITLPLHQPAGARLVSATPARILVVDDEAVVRMLVVDLLRERGHSVQEAEDAFAAMAMVQQGAALDLMITDIGLPGGFDGSTLARRTRQLRPGLPILFITGYAFGTNNDVVLEPGIPVLTKPFTLGALAARIAELLESPRRPEAVATS